MKPKSYKRIRLIRMTLAYVVLTSIALIMLFPFIYMITTSLKSPKTRSTIRRACCRARA